MGYRFSPRIRDLKERKLHVIGGSDEYVYATRAEAAVAAQKVVVMRFAKNAWLLP